MAVYLNEPERHHGREMWHTIRITYIPDDGFGIGDVLRMYMLEELLDRADVIVFTPSLSMSGGGHGPVELWTAKAPDMTFTYTGEDDLTRFRRPFIGTGSNGITIKTRWHLLELSQDRTTVRQQRAWTPPFHFMAPDVPRRGANTTMELRKKR